MRLTVKVFVRKIPIYYNGSESVMVEAGNRFGKVLLLQNFISSQVFFTFMTPVPRNQPYESARIYTLIPFPRRRVTGNITQCHVSCTRDRESERERSNSIRQQRQQYSNKLLSFYFKRCRRLWWRKRPLI